MSAQEIKLDDFGLKFTVPSGWQGDLEEDYIVLQNPSLQAMMVLFENKATSVEQMKSLASQGIFDEGVSLQPSGEFKAKSDHRLEGNYEGIYQGFMAKAYAIGLINGKGQGLNILILSESQRFSDKIKKEALLLADSVEFYEATLSETTKRWMEKLVGNQLKLLKSFSSTAYDGDYSGSSTEISINLCTDGRFSYYYNSEFSMDIKEGSGYSYSTKDGIGSFEIYSLVDQAFLELKFDEGEVYEYELSTNQEGNTFLNDKRYFVTEIEGCD